METNANYGDDHRRWRHERHEWRTNHHLTSNRAVTGVILVLVGLALVVRNTGFFPDYIDNIIFTWPMLLVTIGLVMTIGSSGNKTGGIIIMAVGGFFLIPHIFSETFHMYNLFWPSIFIIIGAIFIFTRRRPWQTESNAPVSGDDYLDIVNIFSGGERQIASQNFKGGKVTAVFGGSEIDLTKAQLAPGRSELELTCIFGGTTLIVPDDWFVTLEVTPVLGGFGDSRKMNPGRTIDTTKQLVIKGAIVFGGGEIKSY
jgi:predicted membrane protein